MNKTKEYKIWLDRAFDDLKWTKSNLREKVFYGACFTAQQAVEKALKAYLIYKQGRFDKIHDLTKLVDNCRHYDKDFADYRKEITKISFYYVQTRYPDISEVDRFTQKEAEEAFEIAKDVIDFVERKIKKI